jgi:hypothetical protein
MPAQRDGRHHMDDLIYCAVGAGLFLAFGVYALLLKRL